MKSIQDCTNSFVEQINFAKYFFIKMGIKINEQISKPKHTKSANLNCYLDDFYYDLSQLFVGANKKQEKSGFKSMDNVLDTVLSLLESKVAVLDSFLVLCFEYCRQNYKENELLLSNFLLKLENIVFDCLCNDESNYKMRNYYYFKEYLLFSNIWLCKNPRTNALLYEIAKNTTQNKFRFLLILPLHFCFSCLLFFCVVCFRLCVCVCLFACFFRLLEQKAYIWKSVKEEEKKDEKHWNSLLNVKFDGLFC